MNKTHFSTRTAIVLLVCTSYLIAGNSTGLLDDQYQSNVANRVALLGRQYQSITANSAALLDRQYQSNIANSAAPLGRQYRSRLAAFAEEGDQKLPPMGWAQFCRDLPSECSWSSHDDRRVILDASSWSDLVTVNKIVNQTIIPASDMENYGLIDWWTYPDNGRGDCEDYVLMKRKLLIEAGWPRGSLLVTVVRDQNNEGHAILTASTDRGDFILDNQRDEILLWTDTGYRFVKRQASFNENIWVSLGAPAVSIATSSNERAQNGP
jgi:predicted transglutaminase-like cysteine proteinase